jgi:D-alanyl-D-alanine carboxypeptidase
MAVLRSAYLRIGFLCALAFLGVWVGGTGAKAAPYAALVMDARTGEVFHSRSADRHLHPASLTKMMTLYLAFEAVRDKKISLNQKVRISRHAARQVPSKIGLRAGRRYTIRDLIRATAVKSANDAAVALGEAIAGSEKKFAVQMTARARQLGLSSTTFKNASGLTARGQMTTARDMASLGRALFYDFPQYYNLFGRKSTIAAGKKVYATNRRLLGSYRGADGIKTGYTNAAGYNLVSSAQRGSERVIAVVLGGKSSRWRNRRIAELLDLGFRKAPTYAKVKRWATVAVASSPPPMRRPVRGEAAPSLLAQAGDTLANAVVSNASASTSLRVDTGTKFAPTRSPLPRVRPGTKRNVTAQAVEALLTDAEAWSIQIGVFANQEIAIAELASAALSDISGLRSAGREVEERQLRSGQFYRARLTGLEPAKAKSACKELKNKGKDCLAVAPR